PLDDTEIACLVRLCRHLRHAFLIHRSLVSRPPDIRFGVELLDRLVQPVALLGRERELRYLNPAGARLFAEFGEPPVPGRPLPLFARDDATLLDAALADLLAPGPLPSGRTRRVLRFGAPDGQALIGIASVLEPAAVLSAFGAESLALLMFHRPGRARHIDPVVVAEAFGLTPAEARDAARLADGLNAEQIAAERSASLLTVRTQIRSILAKTGVRRQPELVRMLVEMPEIGESTKVANGPGRAGPAPRGLPGAGPASEASCLAGRNVPHVGASAARCDIRGRYPDRWRRHFWREDNRRVIVVPNSAYAWPSGRIPNTPEPHPNPMAAVHPIPSFLQLPIDAVEEAESLERSRP